MLEYQKRVIDERSELEIKIDRLISFIAGDTFAAMPVDERVILENQLDVMKEYSEILTTRIAGFEL